MGDKRLMRVAVVLAAAALASCAVDVDDDHGDDHGDYGELVAGDGSRAFALTVSGRWQPSADDVAAGDQQTVQYDSAPPYDGGANCSGTA